MTFLLKHWREMIYIGLLILIPISWTFGRYSGIRHEKMVQELAAAEYQRSFDEKYAKLQSENHKLTNNLLQAAHAIKNDPKCMAPDSVRAVIKQLH